ncbi:hypothetical protein [Vibrio sinensis]|uniref:hypothetical protein n=1 Tax=Vibrio sinensis TaxID=2302434 RepID=UPI001FB32E9F|nr:hypothetical protein [Vibrio sinensis]
MDKALFILLCVFIPFENTMLASIGGIFTAPMGIILIPLLGLKILLQYQTLSKTEFHAVKLLFAFFAYSFVLLSLFYAHYDKAFLIDRGMRFFVMVIPLIIVFLTVIKIDEKRLYQGVALIAAIVIFSFVANLVARGFINGTSPIHYNSAHAPHRMRGFTLEASTFGFQFVLAGLLLAAVYRINLLLLSVFMIACITLITSKGTLVSFLITVVMTFAVFSRINLLHKVIGIAVLAISGSIVVSTIIGPSIVNDLENYTSIATRSTAIMTSVFSLIHRPLGAGLFGFLPAMYEYGVDALNFVDRLFPRLLNFKEFASYLVVGETKSVSTKSFFFDWVIFGGLFFLYFYIKYVGRLFRFFIKNRMPYDFAILLFLVLCTSFFMSIEARYIAPFALGFLFVRYRIVDNKNSSSVKEKANELRSGHAIAPSL